MRQPLFKILTEQPIGQVCKTNLQVRLTYCLRCLCAIVILLGITSLAAGQQSNFRGAGYPNGIQQVPLPTSTWSVTSPVIPDSPSRGAQQDHQSMSPDSWSAPQNSFVPQSPRTLPAASAALPKPSEIGNFGLTFNPGEDQFYTGPGAKRELIPSSQPEATVLDNGFSAAPTIPTLGRRGKESNASAANRSMTDPTQSSSPFRPSGFPRDSANDNRFDPQQPVLQGPGQVSSGSVSPNFQQGNLPQGMAAPTPKILLDQPAGVAPLETATRNLSAGSPYPAWPDNSSSISPENPMSPSGSIDRYPLGQAMQNSINQSNSSLPTNPAVLAQPIQGSSNGLPIHDTSSSVLAGGVQGSGQFGNSMVGQPVTQPWVGLPVSPGQPMFGVTPNYRPDLGHRAGMPTVRHRGSWDTGEEFDFENKKKEYPPLSEIFATGRYFGSASMLYLQPSFQANTAITSQGPNFGQSLPFDFDYEVAPHFRFGFESKYGPGFELNYWQYDEAANPVAFVSNGSVVGDVSTWMMGPSRWSRLIAANPGDRLEANHSIDVEVFNAMFFKEIKFPISRLNGSFGLQYVSIAQSLDATLSNGGAIVGRLNSRSDLRAYGPRFLFEYYRPVGHTKLEFVTSFGGSVLFGERDQFVENTSASDFNRLAADEFVTTTEFYAGAQYKKMIAENRGFFARLGFQYQTWHGGGTAVDAQSDFGLRGFTFGVGYNR